MYFPLLIGLHCHQPVNNLTEVVDDAIENGYLPFLKAAEKYPAFKFTVHYSGWLLEYIRINSPETFGLLQKLSGRGQLEFFSGGFYEPILSAIPSDDRKGQIKMLSGYLEKYFSKPPSGLWLTERVWDPAIIPDISASGLEDVIVDDYHFISSGYSSQSLGGYFRTEQDGCPLNVFPIDQGLRYLIPFAPVEEIVAYIMEVHRQERQMLICFDDGEKFGLWPDTYEWVYESGWLESFMAALTSHPVIRTMHFEDIKKSFKPSGLAYLPLTSYYEMGEWSLFTPAQKQYQDFSKYLHRSGMSEYIKPFVGGSIWKNFLIKYPESNRFHKRTLELSRRDHKEDEIFQDFLYQSQCNDSLWHGLFGGLYLPVLRDNAWGALIKGEIRHEELTGMKLPAMDIKDADFDGYDEIYIKTKKANMQFVPREGGQLVSLELKAPAFNLMNVVARRPEVYHALFDADPETKSQVLNPSGITTIHETEIKVPQHLRSYLAYDNHGRNSFVDHLVSEFEPEQFVKGIFKAEGDLACGIFNILSADENRMCWQLGRNGVQKRDGGKYPIEITKTYSFTEDSLYCLLQMSGSPASWYVQEHNLHFAHNDKVLINGKAYRDKSLLKGKSLEIYDSYTGTGLCWQWDRMMQIYLYTVYTVTLSVTSLELTTQGICLLAACQPDSRFDLKTTMDIKLS